MLISYNWLKSYIPEIPEASKIADLVTFHICEVENVKETDKGDTVFDLNVLPDRAHDLYSHIGVAREIAGLLGLKINEKPLSEIPSTNTDLQIDIETQNCRRYMGRIIKNIKVGPSPKWMVDFLEGIGQRSINNIVDVTNFIMFDLGQPIHAFDLKELSDKKIVVRQAADGEKFELVGSEKAVVTLKNTDMVITDDLKTLAIAGVKGGQGSGIKNDTKEILIEVANFDPVSVRKTARRLSLQTDASKRYENEISPIVCNLAMDKISSLIKEMCPEASFEEIVDVYPSPQTERKISFSQLYVSTMLGVNITNEEIEKILKDYNYQFVSSKDGFEIIVPPTRIDLNIPCDMVEEIGRAYGYEKIVPEVPQINQGIKDNPIWTKTYRAKQKLISDGYKEVMTYVFKDKGEVEILAAASDKNFLRTNLTDGIKESISLNQKNLPLLGLDNIKVFEVGAVFSKNGEEIRVAYGDNKNITETTLDKFCESIPSDFSCSELSREEISKIYVNENSQMQFFKPWAVYPFITRDIAVWIPEETDKEKLVEVYKELGTDLLITEPKLFDSFTKEKRTSYAYRLVFQAKDRTLKDEEINKIMEDITSKVKSLGFEVR